MIKTGIYNLEQMTETSNKRVSITLYDQIMGLPNSTELADKILLWFTDERGAYKRTYAQRFEGFDQAVIQILQQYHKPETPIVIQDLAVSDGRTAVDFFGKLTANFSNIEYHASDYNPKVQVIVSGKTKVTMGANYKVIEIVWPPFVFNAVRPDRYYHNPLNRVVQFFVEKFVLPRILRDYHSGKIQAKDIFLFAPAALNLAKSNVNFKLYQHDMLSRFEMQSDVIRAMNVLNRSYFTQDEFRHILQNLHAALKTDGLLITGSNQDAGSLVDGGVYQRTENGFTKIWQSGNGSPIDELLTSNMENK